MDVVESEGDSSGEAGPAIEFTDIKLVASTIDYGVEWSESFSGPESDSGRYQVVFRVIRGHLTGDAEKVTEIAVHSWDRQALPKDQFKLYRSPDIPGFHFIEGVEVDFEVRPGYASAHHVFGPEDGRS